jgi:acetyl-CoA carboxylase biotin carboxyl carrier protein
MDLKNVEDFIKIAKEQGVSKLSYEEDDMKISVSLLSNNGSATYSHNMVPTNTLPAAEEPIPQDSNLLEITSPFVGTFYRSSSPEVGPYAKIGDRVESGKVLCIIEAMKIMNEIESDITGEIVEICAENETYVEFGQVLFKLKP